MKICISIAPQTMAEALAILRSIGPHHDLAEVRVDTINDLDLQRLLQRPRPPLMITNRTLSEGGHFAGTIKEQMEILFQAARLGAEYVDIEMKYGKTAVDRLCARRFASKIIVSHHNFKDTPRNLANVYHRMRTTDADVVKIATMANDSTDAAIIFNLMKTAKAERKKIIALCMGDRGQMTRILGGKFGNYITFGSLDREQHTAPGQLSVDELKKIFRIHTLNSRTKVFGLVGNPVAHSRGVYFHNSIFRRKKLDAVYVNFLVDHLDQFIETYKHEVVGISITMPFKQEIIPLLDTVDAEARKAGTVNTVLLKKNKLAGYNTDLPAISSLLKERTSIKRKEVVILGTGATSKTMAYAAAAEEANITVIGRSSAKAQSLATQFGGRWGTFADLTTLRPDILMNGTSIGMRTGSDEEIVPKNVFHNNTLVFDAVASPSDTILIHDAKAAGCDTINGETFFKRQAQLQSKLFLSLLE